MIESTSERKSLLWIMVSECLVSGHFVLGQNITVVERVVVAILHGTTGRKHRGRRAYAHPGSSTSPPPSFPASPKIALPVETNISLGVKDTHIRAPQIGDIAGQTKTQIWLFCKRPSQVTAGTVSLSSKLGL